MDLAYQGDTARSHDFCTLFLTLSLTLSHTLWWGAEKLRHVASPLQSGTRPCVLFFLSFRLSNSLPRPPCPAAVLVSLSVALCLSCGLAVSLSVCLSVCLALARSLARRRCDRAEVLEEGLGAMTAAEEAHLREGQAARPGVPKTQQTFLVCQGYMRPVLAFMGQVT